MVPIITIDGARGTGKGTVSERLAKQFGWHFLDSGALYRLLAVAAERHQIAFDDVSRLTMLAEKLDVVFAKGHILLEGEYVTEIIRTEAIGNLASKIAALPTARTALLARQRVFRQLPGLIADGRDMGTVIFPDSTCKIFLTASIEERARRRYNQLKEAGREADLTSLVNELTERDTRDKTRAVSPLKPATDALIIDTDKLTIDQVVERIIQAAKMAHLC